MKNISIKRLFTLYVVLGGVLFILFSFLDYQKMKNNNRELLEQKSLNQVLYVSKKMIEFNDKVTYQYTKYSDDLKHSEEIAQKYFQENGIDAPLEVLKKRLNAQKANCNYDIYLINKNFVIEKTTYKQDYHLDFHELPEALKVLKGVYENEGSIDVSVPRNEPLLNVYKSYIVQKIPKKEYILQLSLSVNNGETIDKFVKEIEQEVPNLLSSTIFDIYRYKKNEFKIVYQFQQDYSMHHKAKQLYYQDAYYAFMNFYSPETKMDKKKFDAVLAHYIRKPEYRSSYIQKEGRYINKTIMPYVSYMSMSVGDNYILALEFDDTVLINEGKRLFYYFILRWVLILILLVLLVLYVNKRVVEPIVNLQYLMKEKKPVEPSTLYEKKDEISSMSLIYNQLLNDLNREIKSNESLLQDFKTFTANSIHQARTPLSVIKISLEMIKSDNKEAMQQIESSLVSIEHLYDTLSYSIIAGDMEHKVQELNVSKILNQRVEFFKVVALANDKELVCDIRENILYKISQEELEFLIDNNLSNALKYSPPYTKIEIVLQKGVDEIILSFKNSGQKIEDTKVIFQRYKRGDSSRKGTGIGLSIVEEICKKNKILNHVSSINGINTFSYYFSKH